jgi:hypothetical protein
VGYAGELARYKYYASAEAIAMKKVIDVQDGAGMLEFSGQEAGDYVVQVAVADGRGSP